MKRLVLSALISWPTVAAAMPPAPGAPLPAPAPAASAAPLPPASACWRPLFGSFGPRQEWRLGLDTSATAGNCAGYAVRRHVFAAGPCRDLLLLMRDGERAAHLGAAVLYTPAREPLYLGRAGLNAGPAVRAGLAFASDRLPYLDQLLALRAPPWAAYIGRVTSIDYDGGPTGAGWEHVIGLKVDLPLDDLKALLPGWGS